MPSELVPVRQIPSELGNLANLQLSLYDNQFDTVSTVYTLGTGQPDNLEYLYLGGNQLNYWMCLMMSPASVCPPAEPLVNGCKSSGNDVYGNRRGDHSPCTRGLRNLYYANQMRYQYGSAALVKSKSPLASANSEKGKALRRICSNPKQVSNRLLGRGDSGIDDGRPVTPCDRKSHRNCRVVDQPDLKSGDGRLH